MIKKITYLLLCMLSLKLYTDMKYKYPTASFEFKNGFKVAYVDQGNLNNQVLLLIHGLGGYIKHWYPIIDSLRDQFRCIAIDLPGYGASTVQELPDGDPLAFFAEAVAALVKHLRLDNVAVAGHSMGGQIAILVAARQPDWLKYLILAAPAGFEMFDDKESEKIKAVTTSNILMKQTEEQIRRAFSLNFVNQPGWIEELISDRLKASSEPAFQKYCLVREQALRGMLDHPVQSYLPIIQAPTLVLFGRDDQLIPNRVLHPGITTERIAEMGWKIPGCAVRLINNAGHMLQVDQPKMVSQIITNFLNRSKK